jgi:ATP-dependent DNA ligase
MKFKKHIYFYPEKPSLVHRDQPLVGDLAKNDNWIAEPKYNGTRCVLTVINGDVSFWTRHGEQVKILNKDTVEYIEMVNEVKEALPDKGHFQFDSELRHHKVKGLSFHLVIWDCFIYNDLYLNRLEYDERRELVLKHFYFPENTSDKVIILNRYKRRVAVIEQFKTDFRKVFDEFVSEKRVLGNPDEFEGLVMKNRKGKLSLGRKTNPNSTWMFKMRIETGRHKF